MATLQPRLAGLRSRRDRKIEPLEPVEGQVGRLLGALDALTAELDRRLTTGSDTSQIPLLVEEMKRLWSNEQAIDAHHVIANRGTRFEALVQRNWGDAVSLVYQRVLAGEDLTLDVVKELHSTLFRDIDRQDYWSEGKSVEGPTDPGTYRPSHSYTTHAGGRRRYFTEAAQIPREMEELFDWYGVARQELHPLESAARFYSRLTQIHPFIDGNGRVSRLVANYILLQADYPPFIYRLEERDEHLAAQVSADEGNHQPLILLMATGVQAMLLHFLELLSEPASHLRQSV